MELHIKRLKNGKAVVVVNGVPSREMNDPLEIAAEIAREKERATRLIELLLSDAPGSIMGESVVEYYERE